MSLVSGAWRAASYEAFCHSPTPCFHLGRGWCVWRWDARLAGLAVQSNPDASVFGPIVRTLAALGATAPPDGLDIVNDLSRMTRGDFHPVLLASIHDQASLVAVEVGPTLRRQAYVLSERWSAAFWLGLNSALEVDTISVHVMDDLGRALDWLEAPTEVHAAVADLVGRLLDDSGGRVALTRILTVEPRISLQTAARRLGVSVRALQRTLQSEGERFATLRERVRLELAKQLLAETDMKLESIAHDSGFGSRRQLLATFRRAVNSTPGAYRQDVRRPPAS